MTSAINSALSGLAASSQRLYVSAQNIANAESTQTRQSDGTVTNEPYVPGRLAQITQAAGGVTTSVEPVNPPSVNRYDPNNAAADAAGITQYPNVDMAEQLVQTQLSLYTAQANISVIRVQDKIFQSTINIIS
jgi:flagellar basal-body rod protein FlgC